MGFQNMNSSVSYSSYFHTRLSLFHTLIIFHGGACVAHHFTISYCWFINTVVDCKVVVSVVDPGFQVRGAML